MPFKKHHRSAPELSPKSFAALKIFIILFLVLAMGSLALVIWKIKGKTGANSSRSEREQSLAEVAGVDGLEPVDREALAIDSKNFQQAKQAIIDFLKSDDPDELVGMVRDGERHREAIEAFVESGQKRKLVAGEPLLQPDDGNGVMRVLAQDGLEARVVNVDLETGLVDWEAFSGANIGGFDDLLERVGSGEGIPLRCKLSFGPDKEYFNYGYTEDEWRVFQLYLPDGENYFWAYVRRASALNEQLSLLLTTGKPTPMTLWLKRASESEPSRKQLEIDRLVSPTWRIYENSKIQDYWKENQ